ncbi:MAG: phosphoribosylformylglycinamidine cyclo-ligase [Candidatus Bathyarchaeota archaeon]|nr:MAG: phosphoribosylformylglycinamidine cyclo-ligase [Candidatus Bathyarchaeota archaeon]
MREKITYAKAGVDRATRAEAKMALETLKQTFKCSFYGDILQLPFGTIFPLGSDNYLDLCIEGVGTKVLLAQLANKFDTIGIDGIAMAVNDVIRSGAKPLAIADNIHAHKSDPWLVKEWMKGIARGALESQCIVSGGEIGDVAEIIKGVKEDKAFDLIVACIGEVAKKRIIFGNDIHPKDVVIGLRSSGLHSNGITLAKRILFKEWGGAFEAHDIPNGFDKELILEALEPTKIYVKSLLRVMAQYKIKGAVHITGDAYLKFSRLMEFSKKIGFLLDNFNPQPIFGLVKLAAERLGGIDDEEMFKTFNMGWGFAIIVDKKERDAILDILDKEQVGAEPIGEVTSSRRIVITHEEKSLVLM